MNKKNKPTPVEAPEPPKVGKISKSNYYVPAFGKVVEAVDAIDAVKKAEK